MIVVSFEIPDFPSSCSSACLRDQIAANIVLQLRLPVPSHRSRDVALVVARGVHIHFHQPYLRIVQVFRHPLGGDQHFRMRVLSHVTSSFKNFVLGIRSTCDPLSPACNKKPTSQFISGGGSRNPEIGNQLPR